MENKVKNEVAFQDFDKIEIRVGTIINVVDFPYAHKAAYQLLIDFGAEIGIKKSSAQITKKYTKEELIGKQIVAVVNFPRKQIGNFMSECLVLGSMDKEDVILLTTDKQVSNGLLIG